MDSLNPIRFVDGETIACPSKYQFNIQDVSAPNSGRTEDGNMHKQKIGQCVKLECGWNYITTEVLHDLLNIFDTEYMTITYLNPKRGGFCTGTFYAGDRTSPMYNNNLGLWENFSVNLIERSAIENGGNYVSSQ